jgi:hypothetical protein
MTPKPEPRYDIESLRKHASTDEVRALALSNVMRAKGYKGRYLNGDTCGISWLATQDMDGQIEISMSTSALRPRDFEVLRVFSLFKMKFVQEESKSVGKVRHFVVQKGIMQ